MELLTTEQEKSLSFDNEQNQVEQDKRGKEVEMLDSSIADSKTGTDGDPLFIKENIEAIESRVSGDTGLRQSSEEGENSVPIDVQREPAISSNLVSPEATDQPPISDINGDSSPMQSIQSSYDIIPSENPIEQAVDNLTDANTLGPSEFGANSENSFTDHPNSVSGLNQHSNLSLNPSSIESSISTISIQSGSNEIIETSITQEGFLKSGHVLSTMDVERSEELSTMDASPNNIGEVSVDENVESSLGKKLNGIVSPGTPLLSEDSYQSGYQDLQNDQNDNVSQTFFDSTNTGSFFTSAGIPAPSLVSAALQSSPGKVLVPAVVDQLQSQAFSALQALKVC